MLRYDYIILYWSINPSVLLYHTVTMCFMIKCWSQVVLILQIVLVFQNYFVSSRSFSLPYEFNFTCQFLLRTSTGILNEIALNLLINSGRVDINSESFNAWWVFFHLFTSSLIFCQHCFIVCSIPKYFIFLMLL